jgi:putative endonuclease
MYYVYVMKSKRDGRLHVGHTGDLQRSINRHNGRLVAATKDRVPFEVVYYEACTDKRDALKRESYLRGTYGQRFLQNRLSNYLSTS